MRLLALALSVGLLAALVQGEYLDRESAKKQLQSPSPR